MALRPKTNRRNGLAAALAGAALLGLSLVPAYAQQSDPMDELLEKLKNKGVLSEDEYQTLKKAREEEQIQLRAERRRQALKEAQETEKQEKEKEVAAKKTKFDASPGIKSIQLFGDVRLRYESRAGSSSPFQIPNTGGSDAETLDRWRYAVRVGIRGDLVEDWFYGLRLDTSANPRSAWVTFGNTNNNATGGTAPYGKNGINIGQAYLGWRATPWLTLQAGKMPNPVYTTPMVWDPDINPEGLAERFNFALNDSLSLFANFGQYIYSQFSPNDNSGSLGYASYDGYQYAWQGGVNYKFGERKSVKAAVGFYNYSGFSSGMSFSPTAAGNSNPNSSGFAGPFACGPQNTQPNGTAVAGCPAGSTGLSFANGINGLRYFEVPWEVNYPFGGIDTRLFGDLAYNIDADQRAAQGSYASAGSQGLAWQIGLAVGTSIGLTMNQNAAKKGAWEARAYWQQLDLNALDPNLIDSDFFEGRTNMQGLFLAFAYSPTDAIITTIRFGQAHRINQNAPTPGSNPDIPTVQPLTSYKLLQLDLTWKF
jgi:Putative porin